MTPYVSEKRTASIFTVEDYVKQPPRTEQQTDLSGPYFVYRLGGLICLPSFPHGLSVLFFSSRNSSVGIVTGYRLDGREGRRSSLGKGKIFLLIVQTGSGAHPFYCPMGGAGGSFHEVKRPGPEADHSPPTSAEVKKMWIYTSTPLYVFMV
jgi:hypothetical protein